MRKYTSPYIQGQNCIAEGRNSPVDFQRETATVAKSAHLFLIEGTVSCVKYPPEYVDTYLVNNVAQVIREWFATHSVVTKQDGKSYLLGYITSHADLVDTAIHTRGMEGVWGEPEQSTVGTIKPTVFP